MNLRNRFVHASAAVGAIAMFALTTLAASADVGVTVNGSAVDISPAPIVQAGRVFVPLRGVFEQLGASVVYSNGTINATGNGRNISLRIGSTQATVNGQSQTIDVAPFIVGESTYVPLRFISEALGDSVSWDDADSIAAIDTGGGSADYYSPGTASYVDTAPPPIPQYDQPYVPQPNYIWQPGYWAWGSYGYYWVPGTWVEAPQTGYLWTPGYWQGNNVGFHWNPGYWASAVGFYGGVNYGGGYNGDGYDGGQWSHNVFRYNTYVTNVNTTIVHNVYINRNVYVNESKTRVSYNGGKYGLKTSATAQQLVVAKQRHVGMTVVQRQHVRAAEKNRQLLASVNHNKPPVLAVPRPLNPATRSSGFTPVKPTERVNPLANVAPVRIPVAHVARVTTPVSAAHAAPPAAAVRKAPTPAYRVPMIHEDTPQPAVREVEPVRATAAKEAAPVQAPVAKEAAPVRAQAAREAASVRAPVVREAAPVRMPAVYAAPARRVTAVPAAPPPRAAPPPPAAAPHAAAPHAAAAPAHGDKADAHPHQ